MKDFLQKVSNNIAITSFSIITLIVFSPFVVYITNIDELWFRLSAFMPMLCLWACLLIVVIAAFQGALPEKICDTVSVVLFAVGVCVYIQGQIMKNDYGVLDGGEIDWSAYGKTAVINTIIWAVVIVLFVVFYFALKKKLMGVLKVFSVLLIAYEILISSMLLIQNRNTVFQHNESAGVHFTTDGLFDVSSKHNVIVFCLDEFDSVTFLEMLKQYPEVVNILDGFTYYPDTVGATGRTKYAVPYFMSGKLFTEPVSYKEYRDESVKVSPLFNALIDNNVNSGIYSEEDYVGKTMPEAVGNLKTAEETVTSHTLLSKDMLKLSCFRCFPHILKKYVWLYSGDFNQYKSNNVYSTSDDMRFFQQLKDIGVRKSTNNTVFRFIHLYGDHGPYVIDENGEKNESDRIRQARGCFTILNEYFEQLKQVKAYEEAYIVVLSDHGRGEEMNETLPNPIFMVKPSGIIGHDMYISDAPMYYSCLQDMFCDAIEANDNSKEYPDRIYQTPNIRYYYHQLNTVAGVGKYKVVGKAYDNPQIIETGVKYTGNSATGEEFPVYEFGTLLNYTDDLNGLAYLKDDEISTEISHTILLGDNTSFKFRIDDSYESVRVYIMIYAQDNALSFKVNGNQVEYKSNGEIITVDIPSKYLDDGKLELVMEHKDMNVSLFNMYINPVL